MNVRKRPFTWAILTAGLSLVVAGCGATSNTKTSAPAPKKAITIGYINWPEDVAVSHLWQTLLAQKGYKVKLINAAVAPTFSGVKSGSISIFMDAWLPHTHAAYWARIRSNAVKLNSWYTSPTQEGFVVPDYVTNVKTIADLKAHASEFSNKIVGIDPGAGEMALARKAIKAYGLPEHLVTSSSSGMLAALSRAESQHKPVVVTLWSPHWAFAKWHLRYLSDPKNIFGPADHIYTIANKAFPTQHPKVTAWLKAFHLNQTQIGGLESTINHYPSSKINSAVKKWISQNHTLVQGWFKS